MEYRELPAIVLVAARFIDALGRDDACRYVDCAVAIDGDVAINEVLSSRRRGVYFAGRVDNIDIVILEESVGKFAGPRRYLAQPCTGPVRVDILHIYHVDIGAVIIAFPDPRGAAIEQPQPFRFDIRLEDRAAE